MRFLTIVGPAAGVNYFRFTQAPPKGDLCPDPFFGRRRDSVAQAYGPRLTRCAANPSPRRIREKGFQDSGGKEPGRVTQLARIRMVPQRLDEHRVSCGTSSNHGSGKRPPNPPTEARIFRQTVSLTDALPR